MDILVTLAVYKIKNCRAEWGKGRIKPLPQPSHTISSTRIFFFKPWELSLKNNISPDFITSLDNLSQIGLQMACDSHLGKFLVFSQERTQPKRKVDTGCGCCLKWEDGLTRKQHQKVPCMGMRVKKHLSEAKPCCSFMLLCLWNSDVC